MKIFLVGFPGCGKSFLGKELALLLKYSFLDTDELVVRNEGISIQSIFSEHGEEYFREAETKALLQLAKTRTAVVATGGGLPCFHDNMEWMNAHGLTVYLEAGDAFLFHRLMPLKKSRPLISTLGDVELMEYITSTLSQRKTFYEKAKIAVNAKTTSAKKLFSKVNHQL